MTNILNWPDYKVLQVSERLATRLLLRIVDDLSLCFGHGN